MKKKEVEKKLKALAKKMQKTYLEYLDSLEEEGNEVGKAIGYLSIAIFRDSGSINSTVKETELKEENWIEMFWINK
jgi:hypothetical protein